MSVTVSLFCKKHPRYKAIKEPQVSCSACYTLYAVNCNKKSTTVNQLFDESYLQARIIEEGSK